MPTKVIFRNGALDELEQHLAAIGPKAFVVTGRASARKTGTLDRLLRQLPKYELFDQVDEDPTTDLCDGAAEKCRQAGCDFVVALGGGSPMDAAKAIAAIAVTGETTTDILRSGRAVERNLPIVAIPTTSGTGSEVTPYSVLVSTEEKTKRTIRGTGLFPVLAVLDPELTISMPQHVTVNTGLDALSQALEGMVSKKPSPMGDILALEICRIVTKWLPIAAKNPQNLDARAQMLYAAMLSGCVIAQTGTTLVHGMGYYYTLEFDVAHGLANGLLLAPVFRFNAHECPEKIAALAEAMGVPSQPEPEAAAQAITDAMHNLFEKLDLSPAAKDHGVDRERLAWCANEVFEDRSRFKNQLGEPTRDEVHAFFLESFEGRQIAQTSAQQ